ncbi:hypothetical protein QRX50_19895 [Amycolatopsis carbonis]|uniref:Preprotein translocase subunit SecA n=1 Tax=Amycolatopsis carbonis TaxID=715471 RepID=A0A9Y2MXZ1_9PSEU|nr:hypothetical protein [Amycolatopsis sp. 2-15]WIX82871.1 hypothetical protein QRX50_19895 [Amycolatopsis sp. 2-15]
MSGKQQKARRARQKRQKAQRQRATGHAAPGVATELALMVERFAQYTANSDDNSGAAEAARQRLRELARTIEQRACGLDLLKAVSAVRVGMIMKQGSHGIEQSAAALEVIALVLACRDRAAEPVVVHLDPARFTPDPLEAAAREALSVGSLIGILESPPSNAEQAVVFRSVQREVNLRNPVYPHMLLDTLLGLFGDEKVNDVCREVLGFTGLEAVRVMEAVRTAPLSSIQQRFSRMEDARDASLPYLEAFRDEERDSTSAPDPGAVRVAQAMFDAVSDLTTNIGAATLIDVSAIASSTGYEPTVIEAVLDTFTLDSDLGPDETLDRFFRGDNPLRTAPIVADPAGRRVLVHDCLALPAVREVIETRLKAAGRMTAYEDHRGPWVEKAAIDLLERALPNARVYRSLNYFVPDPRAAQPQLEPADFTKRVEADGLLLIDDVALIIEVKSVSLTGEARGGVARRLRGKLRDIITSAADQAGRLRDRILTDQRLRLDNGEWLDLSRVREVHTIAVGLEDLSGVTTAIPALLAAGVLRRDNIPWTVSIHDLRVVCELLDRPSELILYLRRRTQPETTWKYRAVDELDLFMLFLEAHFFFEPDPERLNADLPWSLAPRTGDQRRHREQVPQVVESRTEPLDAWYYADEDGTNAAKPRYNANDTIIRLVDAITEAAETGWLATCTALLSLNGGAQRKFGRLAKDLAKVVRQDGQHHSVTTLLGDDTGRHMLLVWACIGRREQPAEAAEYLTPYLKAKKIQTGACRAACLIFDSRGQTLQQVLYDNTPVDRDAAPEPNAGLFPLERMTRSIPRPGRAQRPKR